jgi:hypothetical protein
MYLGLFAILRFMARRQRGHFGPADLLVIVQIADAAQNGLDREYHMLGATETKFFEGAEMLDSSVGPTEKDDAADVANVGFDAIMRGDGDVASGFKNKVQSAVANVVPAGALAKQHRSKAEPRSANG